MPSVKSQGRGQVTSEGLLDNKPSSPCTARLAKLLDNLGKERGRNGKIVGRVPGIAQCLSKQNKSFRSFIVAIDIAHQAAEFVERNLVELAILGDALFGAGSELFIVPPRPGYAALAADCSSALLE